MDTLCVLDVGVRVACPGRGIGIGRAADHRFVLCSIQRQTWRSPADFDPSVD